MQLLFAFTNLTTITYIQVKDLAYPTNRNWFIPHTEMCCFSKMESRQKERTAFNYHQKSQLCLLLLIQDDTLKHFQTTDYWFQTTVCYKTDMYT
jgi:hypothetical protein